MQSRVALIVAALTIVGAVALVFYRGGVIAWAVLILGAGLLAKALMKPSGSDLGMSLGLAAFFVIAWIGTWYYVISTYESGEVVELAIDIGGGETQTARLWVFELEEETTVYFDANPDAAQSLLAGKPVLYTRQGVTNSRVPLANEALKLPEREANAALEAMGAKYGDRMTAADLYYVLLGVPRNRTSLVVKLLDV